MFPHSSISRRTFLKGAGLAAAGAALPRLSMADNLGGANHGSSLALHLSSLSAVWAHDGGRKIPREDLPAHNGHELCSYLWDGTKVFLFGGRNEVLGFTLVLEAAPGAASSVAVWLPELRHASGVVLSAGAPTRESFFDWRGREIELFLIEYLAIRGLSDVACDVRDEKALPAAFRQTGKSGWQSRPDHDKQYPDIAVPMAADARFDITGGTSQSIWCDIYIPRSAPSGVYTGAISISIPHDASLRVPVELLVLDMTLPDTPAAPAVLFIENTDIYKRYLGNDRPGSPAELEAAGRIVDRHFQLAHRHGIALINHQDEGAAGPPPVDAPLPAWLPRLDGSLFDSAHGYAGPGAGRGNGIFAIGAYGNWPWQGRSRDDLVRHADGWEAWFREHSPDTRRFLYLADESTDYATMQRWIEELRSSRGLGADLLTLATVGVAEAARHLPMLSIAANQAGVNPRGTAEAAASFRAPGKELWYYNGIRPYSGTFMIEDDPSALRMIPWAQMKLGIDRWFYWNATYYTNYQGGGGATDVFRKAQTFGAPSVPDPILGEKARNYGNGDGVLFYPGIDKEFPASSRGIDGPIASLRLKYWRRGIQDAAYIRAARAVDARRTDEIVETLVPAPLWQKREDDEMAWVDEPLMWERARWALARIIGGAG